MINRIVLQNFMAYENVSFSFIPGITIISGPNWCGKTSIVNAVRIALGRRDRERYKNFEEFIRYGNDAASIEVELSVGEKTHKIKKIIRKGFAALTKIDGHTASAEEVRRMSLRAGIDVNNPLFVVNKERMDMLIKDPVDRARFFVSALGYREAIEILEELEEKIKEKKDKINALEKELEEKLGEITILEKRAKGYEQKEKILAKLKELRSLLPYAEKKRILIEAKKNKARLTQLKQEHGKKTAQLRELENKEKTTLEAINEWKQKSSMKYLEAKEEEYKSIKAELKVKSEIIRPERMFIQDYLRAVKVAKIGGFIGPVIDLIKVDEQFASAAESALFDALTAIIAASKSDIMRFIDKHPSLSRTKITFLVPESEEPPEPDFSGFRSIIVGRLLNHIHGNPNSVHGMSEEELTNLIRRALAPYDAIVTRTDHGAAYISENQGVRCVSINGLLFIPQKNKGLVVKSPAIAGLFTGGAFKFMMLREKVSEIEILKEKKENLEKEISMIKKEGISTLSRLEKEHNEIVKEINSLRADIENLQDEIDSLEFYTMKL
ncbi:MAG: AAA family ATPase, partial [Candidatus Korarchaeota archaeon]